MSTDALKCVVAHVADVYQNQHTVAHEARTVRQEETRMLPPDLVQVVDQYHRAVDAFVRGDPDPQARLWSRCDDVTLANPLGPPARGWAEIGPALAHAATQVRDGEPCRFEPISAVATADLAYIVEFQRTRARFGGSDELMPVSLRVTTIFRREDGEWRVVHRHADPITAPQFIASVVGR